MKQTLVPGKAVEIPTIDEITSAFRASLPGVQMDERIVRTSENVLTNAAGVGVLDELYLIPSGYELWLYRWEAANVDGFTPGALFNSAAGYVELLADEQRVDWFSLVAAVGGGIPAIKTWSTKQGPFIRNAQRLGVNIVGGPVNTNIEFRIQGVATASERFRR